MNPDLRLPDISSVASTVAALFHLPKLDAAAPPIPAVLNAAQRVYGDLPLQRLLIFAPDAIGHSLLKRNPTLREQFRKLCPMEIPLQSVFPPKTPVCFASMFSGVPPEAHGIRKYERPVLGRRTLFDAAVGAGVKTALVAVKDCSIDLIFRGRDLTYFSERYDPEVLGRTLERIAETSDELIVVYQQEYDDSLHQQGPYSAASLEAAYRHAQALERMLAKAAVSWKGLRWAAAVTPDHGAHEIPDGGGDHGEAIPEDMDVIHFWRFGDSPDNDYL